MADTGSLNTETTPLEDLAAEITWLEERLECIPSKLSCLSREQLNELKKRREQAFALAAFSL